MSTTTASALFFIVVGLGFWLIDPIGDLIGRLFAPVRQWWRGGDHTD